MVYSYLLDEHFSVGRFSAGFVHYMDVRERDSERDCVSEQNM